MKRGKKMLVIIISFIVAISLISWRLIAYLGRSQTLEVKSVKSLGGDIYLIHMTKPESMTWKAGSYANISLTQSGQKTGDAVSGATYDGKEKKPLVDYCLKSR